MERFPMTPSGLKKLQEELKRLKSEERPAIIRAIAEARAHGDLSENAEYHAAKERQSFIEGRIAELEDKTSRAEVIDPSTMSGDTVRFGATVKVVDEETDAEKESDAYEKGIRAGDIITDAGQKKISDVAELEAQIVATREAGRQSVLVLVRREGQPRFVVLSVE
jgi:transcription elongation factor GreA